MKRNVAKKLGLFLLMALMAVAIVGCGGGENNAADDGQATAPLTEEEYQAKVEELSQDMQNLQTELTTRAQEIDPTDTDAMKAILDEFKAPLVEFAALNAPEKYQAAQEKFKSSSEQMILFIDTTKELVDLQADPANADAAAIQEKTETMTNALTQAAADLSAGQTLLNEAK